MDKRDVSAFLDDMAKVTQEIQQEVLGDSLKKFVDEILEGLKKWDPNIKDVDEHVSVEVDLDMDGRLTVVMRPKTELGWTYYFSRYTSEEE